MQCLRVFFKPCTSRFSRFNVYSKQMLMSLQQEWAVLQLVSKTVSLFTTFSPLLTILRVSKCLSQNRTEDNLMSNIKGIHWSLVMWNIHIRNIKQGTAQTENIESLWEYSSSPETNDPCHSQKRSGKKPLLNERCSSTDKQILFLFRRTLQPFFPGSAQ